MRKSFIESSKDPTKQAADLPRSAIGGGFGIPTFKPFKVPTSTRHVRANLRKSTALTSDNTAAGSKRTRVVFTENNFYDSDSLKDSADNDFDPHAAKKARKAAKLAAAAEDSDDDDKKKASSRGGFVDKYVPPQAPRSFPFYKPKPLDDLITKGFAIPGIKKKGMLVETKLTNQALGMRRKIEVIPRPLFDPMEDMAIVLWDPTVDDREAERAREKERIEKEQRETEEEKALEQVELERRKIHRSLAEMLGMSSRSDMETRISKVPVVIDPKVGKVLRPHQVEGVKFLYRCVTGMTDEEQFGCIMADEMGLGKTLQCIALMWTLLKQSPIPGKGTIDKAIVVCPSTLVGNWANELVKWLGEGAINALPLDGKLHSSILIPQIRQWCASKGKNVVTPVLICSYEKLRTLVNELGQTEIGLILADEGHRLKNAENQTYDALKKINCKRRVILTGTPIQNDLSEYYSLLAFCNPGYLGTQAEFRKKFEIPIVKGRDGDASDKQMERGTVALQELSEKVTKFVIRRTNNLLSKYLPKKHEHVVFVKLAPFQLDLYNYFMSYPETKALLRGKASNPLKAIILLRKLCNHPDLLDILKELPGCQTLFPEGFDPRDRRRRTDPSLGGKFAVLDRFLTKMISETNDKLVLISNFTQTLDVFQKFLDARRIGWIRLDGNTGGPKRQQLVDKFNDPSGQAIVFLLSSKAGGCGINLIGANRLILFDPDWNPASDMQALARVWRDGQKKDCFVYRFVATGTVEEKIFQRQSHKQNLSSCVVDEQKDVARIYTGEKLRQLFTYQESACETHELFKCKRCKDGKQFTKSPAMLYGDTSTWNHLTNACLANIHDDLLRAETGLDSVSACFQFIST